MPFLAGKKPSLWSLLYCLQSAFNIGMLALSTAEQIALVQWWLEKRQPYILEALAQTFHRLQRAAIHDVFGLKDGE